VHHGCLLGGCIEVLDWLRGRACGRKISEWDDAVLFLETSEDGPSPLAVARLLRALAAQGRAQSAFLVCCSVAPAAKWARSISPNTTRPFWKFA
jgi:muramoyltetrapeptide carboxypeptidase LdcA involved in peptidoglycan recycling